MMQTGQIEIPLSKKKMLLLLFGAVAFVVVGTLFLLKPSIFISSAFRNPAIIFIAGLASVLFFGLCAIVLLRKLFDKKAGLIISKEGITDNSSGMSAGLVLWSDIEEIETCSVSNQKFLIFIVKDPQRYIDNTTGTLKKKAMEMNYNNYGSPVSISANSLQMNFDNLYNLLIDKMKEYKQ